MVADEEGGAGRLDLSDNGGARPGTMGLARALDSIALAYNPITRQLHFVSPRPPRAELPEPEPADSPPPAHRRAPSGGSSASSASTASTSSVDDERPPKKGLSSFFARGVFPWKSNGLSESKSQNESISAPSLGSSWKIFVGRSNSVGCASTDSIGTDTSCSSGASTPLHHRRQGSNASAGEIKLFEDVVASSVALIQHKRPSNLPAKDSAEELRHRAEYQRMVVAARQREAREAKERKQQLAKQARHEDDLSAALKEWNLNVLPTWETSKNSKKTRDLWWCGLPPAIRGKIWQLAITNNLNLTPQLYRICVERAKQKLIEARRRKNGFKLNGKDVHNANSIQKPNIDNDFNEKTCDRLKPEDSDNLNSIVNGFSNEKPNKITQCDSDYYETDPQSEIRLKTNDRLKDSYIHRNYSEQNLNKYCLDNNCDIKKNSQSNPNLCEYSNEWSMELIQLDIARTFPNLCIFQPGGPYFDVLHELLAAYVCYRPDIGYVQGMSFLAAILILNMDAPEAFVCFANLLNGPVLRAAFTRDGSTMQILWLVYSHLMETNLPSIHKHFQESELGPELYLLEWLYSVFAKAMPLDVACRVWDVFLRDGDEFLFRVALGVLHLYQDKLIKLDFITAAQFLTKLPEDLCPDALFKSIHSINMTVDRLSFQQLFEKYKDNSCITINRDTLMNVL